MSNTGLTILIKLRKSLTCSPSKIQRIQHLGENFPFNSKGTEAFAKHIKTKVTW